jgi:tetratricopeptide (TPR) repeat protein
MVPQFITDYVQEEIANQVNVIASDLPSEQLAKWLTLAITKKAIAKCEDFKDLNSASQRNLEEINALYCGDADRYAKNFRLTQKPTDETVQAVQVILESHVETAIATAEGAENRRNDSSSSSSSNRHKKGKVSSHGFFSNKQFMIHAAKAMDNDDYVSAIGYYKKILEKNADDAMIQYNLGNAYYQLAGQQVAKAATRSYKTAIGYYTAARKGQHLTEKLLAYIGSNLALAQNQLIPSSSLQGKIAAVRGYIRSKLDKPRALLPNITFADWKKAQEKEGSQLSV